MTNKQEKYKKSLIQKIQIAKKNVFFDEEERKEFIKSRFNCSSLKDMSIDSLKLMLDFCNKRIDDIPISAPMTEAQEFKIKELWEMKARDKTMNALNAFIKRVSNSESITFLTKNEATKVLIALNNMY